MRERQAGKSSEMRPEASLDAVSVPLFVRNDSSLSSGAIPSLQSTCAVASVACPQSSTSTVGVNQRSEKPRLVGTTNAVSDRFISAATFCFHEVGRLAARRQTAAGLPANRREVNAST